MTERDTTRLVAWSAELRAVHTLLRRALRVTREAVQEGESMEQASHDLLIYCHGFCAALDGHHRGEDGALFPAIEKAHPQLAPVLRALERDHSMIGQLLGAFRTAVEQSASAAALDRHLEGVAAIMENHFRYEERQLLTILDGLELHISAGDALGPL